MNKYQKVWWEQAKSDHDAFLLLRREGIAQCHSLHYLQMVTEKIAKAYFWRSGSPPPRNHAGFAKFLKFLGQTRQNERERIANLFAFRRFGDFQRWMKAVWPLANDLERLAPALAKDGPNPEYPWPHQQPKIAPAIHEFQVWSSMKQAQGRRFMKFVKIAVTRFPEYADT